MKKNLVSIFFILFTQFSYSQEKGRFFTQTNRDTATNPIKKDDKENTLGFEHRDDKKDSINIYYKYLDSVNINRLDSSVDNFDTYFSIPASYMYLGNNGAAAYNVIYTPFNKPGWDAGFHAFDIYRFTLENTKLYKTTKPFSQLSYQLASGKEQMIKVLHTQNPRPNFNFGFDYRLINAPGFFITQNTNHNSYRIFSNYQGKRKRYANSLIIIGNTIRNSENGGIRDDASLKDENRKKRFTVPVNLGDSAAFEPNPFKSSISTGNIYKDATFFLRQSYDIGKRDSVAINDSTTEYLFYPKLRLQHSFTYSNYNYLFKDLSADSAFYHDNYDTVLSKKRDTFSLQEKWKIIRNDLSLVQFPDTKNTAQFFLAGVRLENISGAFSYASKNFYNIALHGEYRNKTRNKLWDILAKAELYANGLNSGDYTIYATLGRYFNKKIGTVNLFFSNVNRSPSFIYDTLSSFNYKNTSIDKKENITSFGGSAINNFFNLSVKNYILSNLTYFKNFYQTGQYSKLINVLQIDASKKIRLSKNLSWFTQIVLQKTDTLAPVKVPLVFTRNRFAFEGVFYKNLNISTGIEFRYFTPFTANNYSPVLGQFVPQDTFKIKNLPDISAFVHFRIKSFTAYLRAENLNTIDFSNGFGFTNNNFAAPHYPTQGFIFRFGIRWGFVN
jgi:hypothetical protein